MNASKITNDTPVLISKSCMSIWNFYETEEDAKIALAELIVNKPDDYRLGTYAEFIQGLREKCLTPARRISKATWWEALEVLPPLRWQTYNGIEFFFMREFWTHTYTDQYIRVGDKYFSQRVDITLPSTWFRGTHELAV